MHRADTLAFEKFLAVRPAWTAMRSAREAIDLEDRALLHCGPPVAAATDLVQPTLNSAAVACVFEGWARTLPEALELLRSGEIAFSPAQDRRVSTPMAAVVSPSMALIEMTDMTGGDQRAYAPINGGGTGGDPAPRYGRCSAEALDYLRFLNGPVAAALTAAAVAPLSWLPLVDAALTEGDDGHLRHGAAHASLLAILEQRIDFGALPGRVAEFMRKWPFFHFNFWMAAVRCVLDGAEGVPQSSLITAFGGNGSRFGLQLSGQPRVWYDIPATAPRGRVREPFDETSGVGAYGDSAVVEAFGLGAMAYAYAPDMHVLHDGFCPPDLVALPAQLLCGLHPQMPLSRARVGLCARRVVEVGATPVVELGIVERTGTGGGLGAGLYRPELELFSQACAGLGG